MSGSLGIICVRLPNGKLQVIQNPQGVKGEIFENENALYAKYARINEGVTPEITVLDSING